MSSDAQGEAVPVAPSWELEWPSRATYVPGGWTPPPPPAPRPRRLLRMQLGAVLAAAAVVLALVAGGLGYLAYHDNQVAGKWRHLDQAQAAATQRITGELTTANSRIDTLDRQLTTLNGQMGALQNQLSSVADQKEKALDQETVLQQLLAAAGSVANDLQQCIAATNKFESDLNGALGFGAISKLSSLQSEASQVDQICGQAEMANQSLQGTIQGDS